MKNTKSTRKFKNKQTEGSSNPFIKLIEEKERISEAVQKGDSLSTLKGINFVKPI